MAHTDVEISRSKLLAVSEHLPRLLSERNGISAMYTSSPLEFALKCTANDCFANVASQGRFSRPFEIATFDITTVRGFHAHCRNSFRELFCAFHVEILGNYAENVRMQLLYYYSNKNYLIFDYYSYIIFSFYTYDIIIVLYFIYVLMYLSNFIRNLFVS